MTPDAKRGPERHPGLAPQDVLLTGENKTECTSPVEFVQDRICPIACTAIRCVFACPEAVAP